MKKNRDFEFKKAQIEIFVKAEYAKKFRRSARISIRKRQKFMDEMTRKIGKKFGKDVLCLVDFSKGGFTTLVSPAHTESTDLGKLYNSFTLRYVIPRIVLIGLASGLKMRKIVLLSWMLT